MRQHRNSDPRALALLSWQEALAILETCDAKGVPTPFAITFSTANESNGTGGDYIHYERAIWYVPGGRVRRSGSYQHAKAPTAKRPERSAESRWMRRVQAVGCDQIRQLHLHLILDINGQPVR